MVNCMCEPNLACYIETFWHYLPHRASLLDPTAGLPPPLLSEYVCITSTIHAMLLIQDWLTGHILYYSYSLRLV